MVRNDFFTVTWLNIVIINIDYINISPVRTPRHDTQLRSHYLLATFFVHFVFYPNCLFVLHNAVRSIKKRNIYYSSVVSQLGVVPVWCCPSLVLSQFCVYNEGYKEGIRAYTRDVHISANS